MKVFLELTSDKGFWVLVIAAWSLIYFAIRSFSPY